MFVPRCDVLVADNLRSREPSRGSLCVYSAGRVPSSCTAVGRRPSGPPPQETEGEKALDGVQSADDSTESVRNAGYSMGRFATLPHAPDDFPEYRDDLPSLLDAFPRRHYVFPPQLDVFQRPLDVFPHALDVFR